MEAKTPPTPPEADIVKLAEELDREALEKQAQIRTEGRQPGFTKADCEDIVNSK